MVSAGRDRAALSERENEGCRSTSRGSFRTPAARATTGRIARLT